MEDTQIDVVSKESTASTDIDILKKKKQSPAKIIFLLLLISGLVFGGFKLWFYRVF